MPRPEQFQRVEDEYYRLKGKYATGRLTEEEFDQALKDLMFQDSQGRYWIVGADTGEWYASDGGAWVKAQPPAAAPAARELRRQLRQPRWKTRVCPLPPRRMRRRRAGMADSGGD